MATKIKVNQKNVIKDQFVMDDDMYVVLDNKLAGNDESSKLIIGAVVISNGQKEIVPIDEESYEEVSSYYLDLQEAFSKKEEE